MLDGDPGTRMNSPNAGTLLVLLANSPQIALSHTHILYNELLTIVLAEQEWHTYGQKSKALRLSDPRGRQRHTFFLSLPYRYAIPLLVLSGVMQWLASRSLFFAEVDV